MHSFLCGGKNLLFVFQFVPYIKFPELKSVNSNKLKYLALNCFLFIFHHASIGQAYQREIDSIASLIKDKQRADTLRAKDYVDLSTYYFRQNIDTVVNICIEGISFIDSKQRTAIKTQLQSLELSKANLLMNFGFTYYYLNELGQSIKAFYKSLEIAEKYNDKNAIADVRTNIANVQIDLGELTSAQENLEIVLELQEELQDEKGKGRTLNTIGYVHRVQGNDSLALSYYQNALSIRLALDDQIGAAASYNNIAFMYRSNSDYVEAIKNYQAAINIYQKEDELTGLAAVFGNLANCYLELGQFNLAENFATKGYDLAVEQGSSKDLIYLTEALYKSNKKLGNYSTALSYYEQFTALNDSLTSDKHYKELINQELAYEFAEKEKILAIEQEKELALKEMQHANEMALSEAENFRLYFSVVVVSVMLLVVVIFLVFLSKQKRTIEKQSKELELVALRSQMNPHFLFNSLNSIKLFIIENQKELSARYLTKFSKLVRLVLENSNKNLISLEEELEATQYYLELEQIRFKGRFEFSIDSNADTMIQLPPLVLQPYVENAIWHGIMHLESDGMIQIKTSENENGVFIEIEDNGVGRKKAAALKAKNQHKNSMGMEITQKRILALNELLGIKPEIDISDVKINNEVCGTLVKIFIPFSVHA